MRCGRDSSLEYIYYAYERVPSSTRAHTLISATAKGRSWVTAIAGEFTEASGGRSRRYVGKRGKEDATTELKSNGEGRSRSPKRRDMSSGRAVM